MGAVGVVWVLTNYFVTPQLEFGCDIFFAKPTFTFYLGLISVLIKSSLQLTEVLVQRYWVK